MSLKRYAHLCGFALDHPWAITPGMLRVIAGILGERMAGLPPDPVAIEQAVAQRKNDGPQPGRGGVAIIPMYGVLSPRQNLISESSGGTSFEKLIGQVKEAGARSDVKTIVIDCDSPGGSCAFAPEFAATLREVRTRKAIIAVANPTMASAAYWTLSNATKIHASLSAMVGSIGVYSIHNDLSEALTKLGVKRTFISAGKYKLEGIDGPPLSEEGLKARNEQVAKMYEAFLADVAKGRGISASTIRSGYGEGRVVDAEEALALGMVDKVATFDETLDRLLPAGVSLDPAALASSTAPTSQEPSPATDQEARIDIHWQAQIERDLLALSLP